MADARETIAAAAEVNGWEKDPKESTRLTDYYRKGDRYIWAYYTEDGTVITSTRRAATGVIRAIHGKDKRDKVIAELEA